MKCNPTAPTTFVVVLLALLIAAAPDLVAQGITRIDSIRANPQRFNNEVVTVEGYVTQYVDSPAETTNFYNVKDDFGAVIKVRTSKEAPRVGYRYRVTGPVGIERVTARRVDPYLSEENRTMINLGGPGQAGGSPFVDPTTQQPWWTDVTNLLLLGTGLVFVVFLSLLFWYVRLLRRERATRDLANGGADPFGPIGGKPSHPDKDRLPAPEAIIEDKTIKMYAPPDGTLKLLPGRFLVTSGLDSITQINFYKMKGQRDAEVTFGRANGHPYQHIQLKPRTVSSRQAKLIFTNNQFTLVNYASSESNPTTVNRVTMAVNDSANLAYGDEITMGEVEFRFEAIGS